MTNNDPLNITKITLDDCRKLKANTPLWLREFGDFDNIPVMDETVCDKWYGDSTWEDESWHNDVCPSFASYDLMADKDIVVKIWSDYNHEGRREMECEHQYAIHTYKRERYDGMPEDEKCSGDFIDTVLSTNDRGDVFNWVLEQERKNELERRRQVKLKAEGKRDARFEDMIASRAFTLNMYDAMHCQDPSLNGECGFTYFDSAYITIDQKTGRFHTIAGNQDVLEQTLAEAEIWLWKNHCKHEQFSVPAPLTEVELLKQEYDNFTECNKLPAMSADELLVQTKPESDKRICNPWQQNYLMNFINRWQIAMDLDGTDGRTDGIK